MREFIGYRFFFMFLTTCAVCFSIAMPNSVGERQIYDFKLPGGAALPSQYESAHSGGDERNVDSFNLDIEGRDVDIQHANVSVEINFDFMPGSYNISTFFNADDQFDIVSANGNLYDDTGMDADASIDENINTPVNGGAGYVILDAGHGGSDPGSFGAGVIEKDVALDVTLKAAALLREAGVEYILTREADDNVSVSDRARVSSREAAAFLVSVHCDWYKQSRINGSSVLYRADDGGCRDLAELMQSHLVAGLGTADRGVHPHDDITLLNDSQIPAAIVELAFISNKDDASLLKTDAFRAQAAQNITEGICAALEKMIP